MVDIHTRRGKEDNFDTIAYEIDMLNYCYEGLRIAHPEANGRNLFLEGFLLHYRNLVRFFSCIRARSTDLTIKMLLPDFDTQDIVDAAILLDNNHHEDISQYLSHCTSYRANHDMMWATGKMYEELDFCIQKYLALSAQVQTRS